jgi:crotonobetainyl-CoA:carnitine CoA-transferase CaiB-like acyl-CoA transferase
MDDAQAALSGLKVLDLSRVLAGPWAAQILGDLGADVVKIERPGRGDDTRAWGPPFLEAGADERGESAYFLCANRNKKSVTIDFSRPEGARLVQDLAAESDVLIENFKVGGLAPYGLDYESLSARNPGLIYCSITGFGQDGPYASRPGYDFLVQALGGLMSVTGRPDGTPGGGPQKAGVAIADLMTGLYATVGVLAALAHRERSGRGQKVDLSLLDTQIAMLANLAMSFLVTGVSPVRVGNAHPSIAPYEDAPTADGAIVLAIGNDSQFAALCGALGHPEWARDPDFATNSARVLHRSRLMEAIGAILRERSTAHWLTVLGAAGAPCAAVNSIAEAFADPRVVGRGLRMDLPHARCGSAPSVRSPLRLSETPPVYRSGAPALGEHTREVLSASLGLSEQRIAHLQAKGIV